MSAVEQGARQGYAYARNHRIERMTFKDYCAAGKAVAEETYQQENARFSFLFGWRQAGEQNRTIFKLEDSDLHGGEKKVQYIRARVEGCTEDMATLLVWRQDDAAVHDALVRASYALQDAQQELDEVLKHL